MWRRAKAACTGEISHVMMEPPGARPAAIERAEYPPKVPISRTDVADRANVSSSR